MGLDSASPVHLCFTHVADNSAICDILATVPLDFQWHAKTECVMSRSLIVHEVTRDCAELVDRVGIRERHIPIWLSSFVSVSIGR